MTRLLALLRSLGNAGALANAGTLASTRRREDWVVTALERTIARTTAAPPTRRTA